MNRRNKTMAKSPQLNKNKCAWCKKPMYLIADFDDHFSVHEFSDQALLEQRKSLVEEMEERCERAYLEGKAEVLEKWVDRQTRIVEQLESIINGEGNDEI